MTLGQDDDEDKAYPTPTSQGAIDAFYGCCTLLTVALQKFVNQQVMTSRCWYHFGLL